MIGQNFWRKKLSQNKGVVVLIPSALKQFTENQESIVIEGNTIGHVLNNLTEKFSELKKHLYDADGNLRNFVNVFIGDQEIKVLQNLDTKVKDGDEISIIPAIAGGSLTQEETRRYSRHLILPDVGKEGQEKIKNSKILIVGAGGLGSPVALYLAAAGIGTLGIVDFDNVEESNLQRQIIFTTNEIGKSKLESAKKSIQELNPNVIVNLYNEELTSKNAMEILKEYDIVIDGTDNFQTRYLVNDACVLLNKPNVYGSIFRFDGQCSVFNFENGPCYRCLFPNPPPPRLVPSCAEGGVLGVLPGVIGTLQTTEALKIILGKGKTLSGRLLVYNALTMKFRELKLNKNKNCPVCGENATIKELIDYEQFCGIKKNEELKDEITAQELKTMIDNHEDFELIDVREKMEWDICNIDIAKLIPLSKIKTGDLGDLENLSKDKKIVLHCKSGGRSMEVLQILRNKGYKNLKSVTGGIGAWAEEIDKSMPTY